VKGLRIWILFGAISIVWLLVSLWMAPSNSGKDVFIFRDAGWNLAAYGHFESAGLPYMRDLTPRLGSHYTPILALLFAGYASVFPRNAYAGTVFGLLLGLLAAAVSLFWVLRQPPGRLRTIAASAIAALPVVFVSIDRPEPIGLVLSCVVLAVAAGNKSRPVLTGILIALVFLAHPFSAVADALWVSALSLSRNWTVAGRWSRTLKETALTGLTCIAAIAPVALLFYGLDHDSLRRFAAHAFGMHSGMGEAMSAKSTRSFLGMLKENTELSKLRLFTYLGSLAPELFLLVWILWRRKDLSHRDWLAVGACLACAAVCILLFPVQTAYLNLLALLIPLGLLIASAPGGKLARVGLALLLLTVFVRVPDAALSVIQRVEQWPSYTAAKDQPAYLLAHLASPNAIVGLAGTSGSYDLFKPEFRHLVAVGYMEKEAYSGIEGVANCYATFHGPDAARIPFPPFSDASEFELIQSAPQHTWITLFGHRMMRAQWGYGCDLYVKKSAAKSAM
jgi:hypothetical protein